MIASAFAIALLGCTVFASAQDLSLLPKYGMLPKTDEQKTADANFIAAMDKIYQGDLKHASKDTAGRGWRYLKGGDLEDAMRRFNQAWLLDKTNGAAVWGMAAVQASSGKFDESLELFSEAKRLVGTDINFSVDYAKALGTAGVVQHKDALLKRSLDLFESNYENAPQNTLNLEDWAMTLAAIGRYSEAWAKVKLAEATPGKDSLDPRFLADLQARMPQPTN